MYTRRIFLLTLYYSLEACVEGMHFPGEKLGSGGEVCVFVCLYECVVGGREWGVGEMVLLFAYYPDLLPGIKPLTHDLAVQKSDHGTQILWLFSFYILTEGIPDLHC